MTVEERHAQCMEALSKGNAVRAARKDLKRDLAVGKADAASLLLDPPKVIEKVEVEVFLRWVPRIGKTRAQHILRTVKVSRTLPLWALSPSTRERLVELFPRRAS